MRSATEKAEVCVMMLAAKSGWRGRERYDELRRQTARRAVEYAE